MGRRVYALLGLVNSGLHGSVVAPVPPTGWVIGVVDPVHDDMPVARRPTSTASTLFSGTEHDIVDAAVRVTVWVVVREARPGSRVRFAQWVLGSVQVVRVHEAERVAASRLLESRDRA